MSRKPRFGGRVNLKFLFQLGQNINSIADGGNKPKIFVELFCRRATIANYHKFVKEDLRCLKREQPYLRRS